MMDALTLDQFAIFVAVAEGGSFAAAARRLGRAHSAITYAVQRLEAQTGLVLFDRSAYRSIPTPAARTLLPRARRILEGVEAFRLNAGGFAQGQEAQIVLMLSSFVPADLMAGALKDFQAAFPNTRLRMETAGQDVAGDALLSGHADLALMVNRYALPTELLGDSCGEVELVAVASPDHPLAKHCGPIEPDDLQGHVQLVMTNPNAASDGRDYGVMSAGRWYVTDIALKQALLRAGAGWGSMPRQMVEIDLREGRLVQLRPTRWDGADQMPRLGLLAVRTRHRVLGPAGQWLLQRLIDQTRQTKPPV